MLNTKVMFACAGAAVAMALMVWAELGDRNTSGTPSQNAVSLSNEPSHPQSHPHPQSQSITEVKNDVNELKKEIDALIGYGGYDNLAFSYKNAWSQFDADTGLKDLPEAIKNELPTSGLDPSAVSKIKADCDNLEALYNIASKNRNRTGADALVIYHNVAEDLTYSFTNTGEKYGASHILGGYTGTELWINQHK